jgi:hypothetical protein
MYVSGLPAGYLVPGSLLRLQSRRAVFSMSPRLALASPPSLGSGRSKHGLRAVGLYPVVAYFSVGARAAHVPEGDDPVSTVVARVPKLKPPDQPVGVAEGASAHGATEDAHAAPSQ